MKKLVLALVFAGMGTLAAMAGEMNFDVVDADASGGVTIEEATAGGWEWTAEEFAAADTNSDGALDAEEFEAATVASD